MSYIKLTIFCIAFVKGIVINYFVYVENVWNLNYVNLIDNTRFCIASGFLLSFYPTKTHEQVVKNTNVE